MRIKLIAFAAAPLAAVIVLAGLSAPTGKVSPMTTPKVSGRSAATYFTILRNDVYSGWSVNPPGGVTKEVAAVWHVPKVACTWQRSRAAVWVGIWGQNNSKNPWLAQTGTISACFGHVASYRAFIELVPSGPEVQSIKVNRGDDIFASVTYKGRVVAGKDKGKLEFVYTLDDSTDYPAGLVSVTRYTNAGVQVKDAAWQGGAIVEREPGGGLAKFTPPITIHAGVNGWPPDHFSGRGLFRWDMVNSGGKKFATTGAVNVNGDFSVTWIRSS